MLVEEPIKILCIKSGISMAEMARRLDKSPQAFNQKVKRETLTLNDLADIALVAGCEFKGQFVFPNGDTIVIE